MISAVFMSICLLGVINLGDSTVIMHLNTPVDGVTNPVRELRMLDSEAGTEPASFPCGNENACGWKIYNRFTREDLYFTPSLCYCPVDKDCTYFADDLQKAAYEYRCTPVTTSTVA
ncbi:hypothetical protein TNCT_630241 [Trichonephila clavata]|uniref:Uncharacterized protein n=1 Tax=Trichonephila clavata TaxID=2740835 RepID=A0A8X6JGY8_TRICU|nr:hypothetical protein TNCT_630241 [Trichonephila clavata]